MYGTPSEKIRKFYSRHRRMPSYSEIMGMAGFKSKNAAYKLVGKLVEQGVVAKHWNRRLQPLWDELLSESADFLE